MVVDDLDVVRVPGSPAETDPPLLVDTNAVLPRPIPFQLLQAVAGRDTKVIEHRSGIEHSELPENDLLDLRTQLANGVAVKKTLSVVVPEALDHVR